MDTSIKNPGDLIYSNIAGPEQSYHNKNNAINLVDEISGLVHAEFMKYKSEVPEIIEKGLNKKTNYL